MLLRLVVILCLISFIEAQRRKCPNSTCSCVLNSNVEHVSQRFPYFEIKCPSEINTEITFQVLSNGANPDSNKIICYNHEESIYDHLPNLQDYMSPDIALQDCPLFPEKSLTRIFGSALHKVTYLHLEVKNVSKYALVENHFAEFRSLNRLNITAKSSFEISQHVFDDQKTLEVLHLTEIVDPQLPDGIFHPLIKLKELWLTNNSLERLQPGGFKRQTALLYLYLNDNKLQEILKDSFKGLDKLKYLDLKNNELASLNSYVFEQLKNLNYITLSGNKFKHISEGLFKHNKELTDFNLTQEKTQLEFLPTGLLANLTKLQRIIISCGLKELPEDLFAGSESISEIFMSGNQIQNLPENTFQDQLKLRFLSLNNSKIQSLPEKLFANTLYLEKIFLSHNQLKIFNCDCFQWLPNLKFLGLDGNKIERVDCKDSNPIKELTFPEVCFAFSYCFVKLYHVPFKSLTHLNLSSNSISYFHQNIVRATTFKVNKPHTFCKDLSTVLSKEQLDYLNSNVYEIKNKMIYLDLKNNHINSFNDESIKAMYVSSSLQFIYLGNNSWNCDCKDRKTIHFLQTYSDTKIRDKENIKCFSDGKLVSSLDIEEICSNFIWIVLGSTFAVLGLIVASSMVFFYKYSLEIKCWLYNHNFCLRFVTKEDLDEEKIYDAFISYAHQDEAFVENVLVTALETGPNLYKICIHVRDRIGGESTVEQAQRSVNESRRTIVVMSSHFMESVWNQKELMFTFQQYMEDKRLHVILIIKGDIEEIKKLAEGCPLILAYLKSHTYIEWNDRWFWNKLKYAMPHKGPKIRRKRTNYLEYEADELEELANL